MLIKRYTHLLGIAGRKYAFHRPHRFKRRATEKAHIRSQNIPLSSKRNDRRRLYGSPPHNSNSQSEPISVQHSTQTQSHFWRHAEYYLSSSSRPLSTRFKLSSSSSVKETLARFRTNHKIKYKLMQSHNTHRCPQTQNVAAIKYSPIVNDNKCFVSCSRFVITLNWSIWKQVIPASFAPKVFKCFHCTFCEYFPTPKKEKNY